MISEILTNCEFLWSIIENTWDSKKGEFMWIKKYALESTNLRSNDKCVYVMDNVSIHHSYSSIEIFKRLNLCIMYLPAYSPDLTAIKLLFRPIKNKLRSRHPTNEYSFLNLKERMRIFESISDTNQNNILNIWSEWITKALISVLRHYKQFAICFSI